MEEYGNYVNIDHDWHFSIIQSAIRFNDFPLINSENSWKYLGVFEISDITGIQTFSYHPDYQRVQKENIAGLITFLSDMGIDKKRIFPSYCAGGSLQEITAGKYRFGFQVPEDKVSREAFLEAGIPEKNLALDKSRATFLSLNLYGNTSPWGYRNEVNLILKSGQLLDIATAEYFLWKPVKNKGEIIGLDKSKFGCSLSGVGLERLCMVANGLERVQDVDSIRPFYETLEKRTNNMDYLAGESLRALHRIFSDVKYFGLSDKLSKNRKEKIRIMLRNLGRTKLTIPDISDLLQVHSQSQPWHPEMEEGIKPTIERIEQYMEVKQR